jgi:hypothetical protein
VRDHRLLGRGDLLGQRSRRLAQENGEVGLGLADVASWQR